MSFKDFFGSKKTSYTLSGILALIVALLIFQAGMFVGYHKARFSYRMGDNFHRTFGERKGGPLGGFGRGDFPGGHGTIGKIIKIDLPTLVIEDRDNVEKIITIKDDTTVRHFRESVKTSDLKTDDYVVVIGTPNDSGQIEARLIRIVPPPLQPAQ
ncbi:MAG: hypothetical protein A3J04_01915 [Candidatus Ryanbacteria bacterium RIFCSPLOWO2_02_FULL_47_14]|uniref:DUF5666 domain-containing protein n=1 Tax=Candidatus Ryanbacteria bacterium RIFCSPLOWO2_02_FULL_47_14 TaxID=1802129 RepID=A0A1G2H286_9BACT|nr:MAG: hypothetical protein A3J04_01915 [Candidatus Ryanbacteria bacterium RIFCSPLOWO2_02_FULL_47_14]